MPVSGLLDLLATFAAGVSAASVAWLLLGPRQRPQPGGAGTPREAVFLFQGDSLLDATANGHTILSAAPRGGTDRDRLAAALGDRFPGLARVMADLPDRGALHLAASDGSARIEADWKDGTSRLRLVSAAPGADLPGPDGHALAGLLAELDTLRAVTSHAAVPIWCSDPDGHVTWANATYMALAAQDGGDWPLPRLFPDAETLCDQPDGQRMALDPGGRDRPAWFRVHATRQGETLVFTALPEDSAIAAERELGAFVQTLAGTFAHLAVGLAIFDADRRLVLFNPALGDLTGLPAEFLANRPGLDSMIDGLRERRTAPEPRDFAAWRRKLAAKSGDSPAEPYSELWPLADGRTFRVSGRPHRDGALALVIEDITPELTLARRFQSDLELAQAVIDSLDEAIAVFSPGGLLTHVNRAYVTLWQTDPLATIARDATLQDATRLWRERCVPTPVWGDAQDFAAGLENRRDWSGSVRMKTGETLDCRFQPLIGGGMLAGFRRVSGTAHGAPPVIAAASA